MMKNFVGLAFFGFFIFLQECPAKSIETPNLMQTSLSDTVQAPAGWPWRGVAIVSHKNRNKVTESAIENLAAKGVNFIRLRLSIRDYAEINDLSVKESFKSTFDWADQVIEWSKRNNVYILISVSDFPSDPKSKYTKTSPEFWNSKKMLTESLRDIRKIVRHFDRFTNVAGYEFFAEPVVQKGSKSRRPSTWNHFFERIVRSVRRNSDKYIVYTPGPWGKPAGYDDMGKKINDPRIIYNFHFYQPHKYTHQGVRDNKNGISYPGKIGTVVIDKNELLDRADAAMKWARKNNVKYLFAGEFSVVRWAEGKNKWLEDVLSIFDNNNISWAYFAFNGWKGWDYEYKPTGVHKPGKNPELKWVGNTQTKQILESYWVKNLSKSGK